MQPWAQELGRGHDPVPVRAVGRTAILGVPGRRQQAVRSGHNLGQERLPGRGRIPVDLHSALETGRQEPGIALPLGPGGQLRLLHPGPRAEQLPDAVRPQIVRCPSPPRAPRWASCLGPLAGTGPAAGPASGPIPGCAERARASAHAAPVAPGNAAACSAGYPCMVREGSSPWRDRPWGPWVRVSVTTQSWVVTP